MSTRLRRRLGVITIGQSPRTDMVPQMQRWMPEVDVVERGALDGLDRREIVILAPTSRAETTLTTRLRDGTAVTLAHHQIVPRVQSALAYLEQQQVDGSLLLCTGAFPALQHARPFVTAERLLVHGVAAICGSHAEDRVGVVNPLPEQEQDARNKWAQLGLHVVVAATSPYARTAITDVAAAAEALVAQGARHVVLDCMGYTEAMRAAATEACGVPVLLSRSVVARLAAEVVA